HDGRWQVSLVSKPKDLRWQVSLSILDLRRSASPAQVLLSDDVPLTTGSEREVAPAHILLSKDERQLYVLQAHLLGAQWHTRLFVVDVSAGKLTRSAEVSSGDSTSESPTQLSL